MFKFKKTHFISLATVLLTFSAGSLMAYAQGTAKTETPGTVRGGVGGKVVGVGPQAKKGPNTTTSTSGSSTSS